VGTASVVVQPPSGTNSNALSFAVNAAPAPTIGSLSPASAIAGGLGFTLTVTGTNFVSGDQVLWNSTPLATTFSSATQLTASIAASLITSVGTVSVVVQPPSGANSNALSFAINAAPVPTIGALSPASAIAGGPGFTLTVTGTNLVAGDQVLWNSTPLATTSSSSTQLTASIAASLITSVGTASVVVQPPSGANSNALSFVVNAAPAPAVNSLSPSSATMGGLGFTLTVNGSNFILGDTVLWSGTSLSTTFVNATQLTAAVPASLIASVGTFSVGVQPPSGTPSNLLSFIVSSASPTVLIGDQTVEAVPDSNSPGGAEAFQSKAFGTGTVSSLVVYVDGASGATQLSAGIYADSGGSPGSLLSLGSSTTIKSAAWNTIPIPPANVIAGTTYWIAILGTGGTLRFRDGSGCTSVSSAQTNLTTLPSNWTTGSSWPSCPLSAYGVSTGSSVPPSTYSISGTIGSAANGAGSTVVLSGTANASTTADASGNFTFTGLANGSYALTPSKPGFSFSPSSLNVTVNGANLAGVNFMANALSTSFTVSGSVSPVTNGAGTTLSLNGASSNTTNADTTGNYSFSGLASGSYTVTPSKSGFTFNPTVQPVAISSANVTAVNFTATAQPPTFSISGSITPSSSGSGATIALGGTSAASTIADSSGNYVFNGLSNGAYSLTPAKTNFTFSPSTQTISVNGANVAGANFTASSSQNFPFFDDFLAATLDPTWTALNRPGDASGSELQCNTPTNVALAGGTLIITSQQQSMPCGSTTTSYTSGAIQWTSFNFTYGTLEYRMQLPGGSGLRPVFWLLGSDCQASNVVSPDNIGGCNWPFPGSEEIDITEILGSNYNQINQGLISSAGDHGCVPNIDVSAGSGYHVYQLVWSPGSLIWKVDGTTTCTVSSSAVPSTPMFLIMETTVGGSGGAVDSTTLPQNTLVDYVKVTQP
jgi:beta-glucanase (GH16 family)